MVRHTGQEEELTAAAAARQSSIPKDSPRQHAVPAESPRPGTAGKLGAVDAGLLPQLVQQLTLNVQSASTPEEQGQATAALQAALQAAAALSGMPAASRPSSSGAHRPC